MNTNDTLHAQNDTMASRISAYPAPRGTAVVLSDSEQNISATSPRPAQPRRWAGPFDLLARFAPDHTTSRRATPAGPFDLLARFAPDHAASRTSHRTVPTGPRDLITRNARPARPAKPHRSAGPFDLLARFAPDHAASRASRRAVPTGPRDLITRNASVQPAVTADHTVPRSRDEVSQRAFELEA